MEQFYVTFVLILTNAIMCRIACADTPGPEVVLGQFAQGLDVGPGMDAQGLDLRGCKFVAQNLDGANFDGAFFDGAILDTCSLKNATFRNATLSGLSSDQCILDGAVFSGATINDTLLRLSEQQLMSTKSYENKNLTKCFITGPLQGKSQMSFRDFRLDGANFVFGDFRDCDFDNANATGTVFGACRMNCAQLRQMRNEGFFRNARFSIRFGDKADFSGMDLYGSFIGWVASDVDLTDTNITGCQISGKAVPKSQLTRTKSFREGNLVGISFDRVDLTALDLSKQNLTNCGFSGCNMTEVRLVDAVITGVDFQDSQGLTLGQLRTTWNYKNGRMAGIRLPHSLREILRENQRRP